MNEKKSDEKRILVTRSSMPPYEEYMESVRDLWDSVWLTNMGKKHNELTERLKDYLKVENLSLFVNGHMALETVIGAMGLTGEVITTPFTFVSTVHAIVRNGLTPVFCDIEPDNYTMDPDRIEELITDKTSAIVPVHVYGNVCDVERIEKRAKKHGLRVIYDAAHVFGVTYKGRGIGSFGDASMFSFHATKVFNTIEGGAVATGDRALSEKLDMIRDFGIKDEEVIGYVGPNAKMNEFAAAMGLCNLNHTDLEIGKRKEVFDRYMDRLSEIKGLSLPKPQKDVKMNYAYFPVVFDEKVYGRTRDEVKDELERHNIFSRKYFYPLINEIECYRDRFAHGDTKTAKRISDRVLTIPMYASLEKEDVDRICDVIAGYRI
ncbi:MAG: DegT/DnrJ/EryC1/StrS family aminotransferase [Lachnospiraceae bacterium]|nr:DegT/DnrJ/EryC1/StrS family aminotransferase [Lachnospiraceae bacterium]